MAAERDRSEVLLAFTPNVPDVLELLVHSRKSRPEMGLVVAIPGPANGSLGEALMAGRTRDRDPPGRADRRRSRRPEGGGSRVDGALTEAAPDTRSPLVVVLGPKGGVGKTTVATNLATTLAAQRPECAPGRSRPPVR